MLVAIVVASIAPVVAHAQTPASNNASTPEWVEPRGLSILDMVGQAPEKHLIGSNIQFVTAGVMQYTGGRRDGDQVTVNVSMSTFYNGYSGSDGVTKVRCLGRRPVFDEWPVSVPEGSMRLYSDGTEITSEILDGYAYYPARQARPKQDTMPINPSYPERYEEVRAIVNRTSDGSVVLPANMGCTLSIPGRRENLTASFVFDYPQQIVIESVGSEVVRFRSYVGPGFAGRIDPLAKQLANRFPSRNEGTKLTIPTEADYVWFRFPPTPVSPYVFERHEVNVALPSSGTYRLLGDGFTLSVDHMISQGLPLHAQWIDSDLAGNVWLERTQRIHTITAPEYFVPPGIAYDACMSKGGCPNQLLDSIYKKVSQGTLYYYRVRRLSNSNLIKIPLRQVGNNWQQSATSTAAETVSHLGAMPLQLEVALSLPLIMRQPTPAYPLPDDAAEAGCPCGWFDDDYRMLDVVPGLPQTE